MEPKQGQLKLVTKQMLFFPVVEDFVRDRANSQRGQYSGSNLC